MATGSGPGRIYAWVKGIFADSSDPDIVHYFTAEDVVMASIYCICIAVAITVYTWGPLPHHFPGCRSRVCCDRVAIALLTCTALLPLPGPGLFACVLVCAAQAS